MFLLFIYREKFNQIDYFVINIKDTSLNTGVDARIYINLLQVKTVADLWWGGDKGYHPLSYESCSILRCSSILLGIRQVSIMTFGNIFLTAS